MAVNNVQALPGPDLRAGVKYDRLAESEPMLGHFDGEPVILVRQGDQLFATGAVCTHYGGPLAEGLVVDQTIRCPWHHARFDLRSGEAEGAPALNPLSCFNVLRHDIARGVGGLDRTEDSRGPNAPFACCGHRSTRSAESEDVHSRITRWAAQVSFDRVFHGGPPLIEKFW